MFRWVGMYSPLDKVNPVKLSIMVKVTEMSSSNFIAKPGGRGSRLKHMAMTIAGQAARALAPHVASYGKNLARSAYEGGVQRIKKALGPKRAKRRSAGAATIYPIRASGPGSMATVIAREEFIAQVAPATTIVGAVAATSSSSGTQTTAATAASAQTLGATYTIANYVVSPANTTTFPWLNGVAKNFQRYRFRKLVFELKSETPTSIGGSWAVSFDHNPDDTPSTPAAVMSKAESRMVSSYKSTFLNLKPSDWLLFDTNDPAEAHSPLYTYGVLSVMGSMNPGASAKLFVRYVVELALPENP